ncbi:MAG TPA: UDP-N-acetylglucosamine--N-acetylmuramyl-(pentapeptide) pyrophosphoryl-undecaprenol N-acetylglucosamine transferase [Phototrophicaceae bacterium]|jgi:UDP-N-acetylglucosamine--N-acetylmuramyl-(pentapeptide) pyrophosphoryl-undecaprenol N-acetylglucosamine transferase|nr:UDP-N-acetylglucosamine--N-acetylmuramyl-(pentapeptide) pyrophosphoryl-undecaprenol N-acetylglucosamine transferase [Phototrophicaceae bacterium]
MLRRVLITAGGTGGHVYPALAVAEALHEHCPETEQYFVGSAGGFERNLIQKSGLTFASFDEVQAGPVHGINPLKALVSGGKLIIGTGQAFGILRRHKPEAILSTGGWASLPIALAAWFLRIPLVIYLPDIEPGLTIKTLRPFSRKICVTTAESAPFFRADQMVVTGYPLREQVLTANREQGIAHFKLDTSRQTLLVFGGSLGSRNVNIALIDTLPELLKRPVQIIHVTGNTDYERSQEQVRALKIDTTHYHDFAYLHGDMGLAFAAADMALCRSGASILGELPYFGLVGILVPYPYAWRYQKVNADYMAKQQAAIAMEDASMERDLLPTLLDLLDHPAKLAEMKANAAALAQPQAAWKIAQILIATADPGKAKSA